MKKIFLTKTAIAASAVGLSILSVSANANNCKFYVGAGLDYAKYSLNQEFSSPPSGATFPYVRDIKKKGLGVLAPVVGMTFHENFGVEAGYSFSKAITGVIQTAATTSVPVKSKIRNMYLDLVGFMPVLAGQCDLIGGIGVGKITAKKDNSVTNIDTIKNKLGWRVKAGVQYNVHTNVALRALVTYQTSNNKIKYKDNTEDKFIKNMTSVGLSAVYIF